jgi:transposase
LVENKVISLADIAYVLGMSNKKLSRWYKHVLSGYEIAKSNGEIYQYDHKPKGSARKIRVPIVNLDHMGPELAIDDKHFRGRYHTILSNNRTGKIILIARSIKASELCSIISKHVPIEQRVEVRVITKDGAEIYDWVARQMFPNATKILDKFHVLKWAFDALQQVRIQLKTEHIIEQRKNEQELQVQYIIASKKAKKNNIKINRKDYKLTPQIHENGDSTKKLLTRSRFLLYKYEDQWNNYQEQRAQLLFDLYPNLLKMYVAILEFRTWYAADQIGKDLFTKKLQLQTWIAKIRKFKNMNMNALATSVSRHSGQIINYFIEGFTNAPAETVNRNLKRLIGVSYGIRELDYFYFRLNKINSSTSN